ncbi:MAG: SufD family Fe-S cluster assembly protein [Cyanobacteriota bacterium]|nr:SufD family Fe-S cluster assembly protein [Cyanobacteriota bacterium]
MVAAPLSSLASVATPVHPWIADLLAALPVADGPGSAGTGSARTALAARGLPSRRQESWRFTDPAAIAAVPAGLLQSGSAPEHPSLSQGHCRLRLDALPKDLSNLEWPEGIEPLSPAEVAAWRASRRRSDDASQEDATPEDWPALLNAACGPALLALRVRGAVPGVLELISEAGEASGVLPLRVLLLLDPDARLELLQVHRAAGSSLTSVQVAVELAAGAELRHGLVASGGAASVLLAGLTVHQQAGSRFSLTSLSQGWGLVRLEPQVVQLAGAAETRLRGLQLVDERQLADTHSRVRFDGPDGRLDQLHKVVADGRGRSVFNGAVCVPRQAQRTDASQLSRSLLLSDSARVDTKPELEIVADDVRCAHGATVSRLQDDELFYLRSRGIAAAEAARLLLRGYCQEILDDLPAAGGGWPVPSVVPAPEARR